MSLCTSHLGVLMRSGHYSRHGPVNSKDGAGKYFYGIPTRLDPIVAFPTLKSDNKYQNPHLLHRSWQREIIVLSQPLLMLLSQRSVYLCFYSILTVMITSSI